MGMSLSLSLSPKNRPAFGPELVTNSGPFTTSSGSQANQTADIANDTAYRIIYTASASAIGNIILYANGKAAVHNVLTGTNTAQVITSTVSASATDTIRVAGLAAGTLTLTSVRRVL